MVASAARSWGGAWGGAAVWTTVSAATQPFDGISRLTWFLQRRDNDERQMRTATALAMLATADGQELLFGSLQRYAAERLATWYVDNRQAFIDLAGYAILPRLSTRASKRYGSLPSRSTESRLKP